MDILRGFLSSMCPLAALLLFSLIHIPCEANRQEVTKVAKKLLGNNTIQLNTTDAAAEEMYSKWASQAVSSLMASMANERISEVSRRAARQHAKCAKKADDLQAHAKCVQRLLDHHESSSEKERDFHRERNVQKKEMRQRKKADQEEWQGAFRVRSKRAIRVVSKDSYKLIDDYDRTAFGLIAKQITNSIRAVKNKKENRSWKSIVATVKETGKEIEQNKKVQAMLRHGYGGGPAAQAALINRMEKNKQHQGALTPKMRRKDDAYLMDNAADSGSAEDIPLQTKQTALHLPTPNDLQNSFLEHPEDLLRIGGVGNNTEKQKEAMVPVQMIREGVKLGFALAGKNISHMDDKSLKLISPRFFSLVPDEYKKDNNTLEVLSPSLFSLHDEGKGIEKITSLSTMMGTLFNKRDRNDLMDLITEAAGISEAVEDAQKKVSEANEGVLVNSDGQQVQLSKKNITDMYGDGGYEGMKAIETVHKMYTQEQLADFNRTGYALMTPKQRDILYAKGAPFENSDLMQRTQNISIDDVRHDIKKVIRGFADGKAKLGVEKRMKDIVGSPVLFTTFFLMPEVASQALILSPVLFSSLILSPAIFGSVILSPWLFVPVILAPRIFSPVILSPSLFSTVILSPLVMDPAVLTPGVGNVFVLSPFLLTPLILSPQVMTPIILCPMALSPLILSPSVMMPIVLSPFVLSPSILSPASVTAILFSPSALSPPIASVPSMFTIVASPSVLS